MSSLHFQTEPNLDVHQYADILIRSTLSKRRPIDDLPHLDAMLQQADLIITARDHKDYLIGIARALTDFAYCTHLADLAVDQTHQRRGIGKRLITEVQTRSGQDTEITLLSAPAAATYYPHIGLQPHRSCWVTEPGVNLRGS